MSHNDEWIGQGWIGMGMVAVGNHDAMSFDGHTDDFLKKIGKVFSSQQPGFSPLFAGDVVSRCLKRLEPQPEKPSFTVNQSGDV